jgi:hypothetical protein
LLTAASQPVVESGPGGGIDGFLATCSLSSSTSSSFALFSSVRYFITAYFVDCQLDGVSAVITISAPDYTPAAAQVDCVRPQLRVGISSFLTPTGNYRLSVWSDPVSASLALYAYNPGNPNAFNTLIAKPGGAPIPVDVHVSDPSVLKTSGSKVLLRDSAGLYLLSSAVTLTPAGTGTAAIEFSSPDGLFASSAPLLFAVGSPFNPIAPAPIPGGFQSVFGPSLTGRVPAGGTSIVFTSGDPEKLLITQDTRQPGAASITVPLPPFSTSSPLVNLQALASSGEAPLTISVEGFEPVTVPIPFREPFFTVNSPLLSASTLGVGESAELQVSFESRPRNPQSEPVRVSLESSDPAVVKVTPAFVDLSSTSSSIANFQIQAVSAGTASVNLGTSNGAAIPAGANPLTISVLPRRMTIRDIEVGKNLMGQMTVVLPPGTPSGVTLSISTSDPLRVLVAASATAPGESQISIRAVGSQVSFLAVGLSDSGQAQITVTAPELGSAPATVTLVPSGFGWFSDLLTSTLYSIQSSPAIAAFALDPITLGPIAQQRLRLGVTASVGVTGDNPDVAIVANPTITLPASSLVTMRNVAVGDAVLTLIQPPGFTTPASKQRLIWRVEKASLFPGWYPRMGIHTQQRIGFLSLPPAASGKIATIRSSNPEKLLISPDPNVLGFPVLESPAEKPIYVQALDNRGFADVTASIDGFKDIAATFELTGTGILLTPRGVSYGEGGSLNKNDGPYTTLFSDPTRVNLNLALVDPDTGANPDLVSYLTLQPGMDASVVVQSTNPAVGIIRGSPARLDSPGREGVLVEFEPVGLGETELLPFPLRGSRFQRARWPYKMVESCFA